MNRYDYFRTDYSRLYFDRSRFHMPFQHTTAFNVGDIVPLEVEQIYPGDGIKADYSFLLRTFTPLVPQMSNLYLDIYAFFVPNRIVWEHWENFYGQNDTSAWTENIEYVVPCADFSSFGSDESDYNVSVSGSFADYLGIPSFADGFFFESGFLSDLYRRAYLKIYNDWFRDENWQDPILFSVGDAPTQGETFNYWSNLLKANKFHDYFTSLLPEPLKGTPVQLGDAVPVVVGDDHLSDLVDPGATGTVTGLNFSRSTGENFTPFQSESDSNLYLQPNNSKGSLMGYSSGGSSYNITPSNLWSLMSLTIEDIRNAAVVQHVFERLAQSGSRYVESLLGLWGVQASDARLAIPEYLGGQRHSIKFMEVLSTTDSLNADQTAGQPIGQTGAFSKTGASGSLCNFVAKEHGMYFVLGVVRVEQTYWQGINRKFTNKDFFDFYMPQMANIGYQPVYVRELLCSDDSSDWDSVLGYNEAWSFLRYTPYQLSSIMRPGVSHSLGYWNSSDFVTAFSSYDYPDFLVMEPYGFDRTLAVPSTTRGSFQFFGDFKFDNYWTRILPPHSIPGLTRI